MQTYLDIITMGKAEPLLSHQSKMYSRKPLHWQSSFDLYTNSHQMLVLMFDFKLKVITCGCINTIIVCSLSCNFVSERTYSDKCVLCFFACCHCQGELTFGRQIGDKLVFVCQYECMYT